MIFTTANFSQARKRNLGDYFVAEGITFYAYAPNSEDKMQFRKFLLESWMTKRKSAIEILGCTYEGCFISRYYIEPDKLSNWTIILEREERPPMGYREKGKKRPPSFETTVYDQLETVITDEKKGDFVIVLKRTKPAEQQRI